MTCSWDEMSVVHMSELLSNYPIHRHGREGWGFANAENSLLHQVYTVSGRTAVCTE